MGLMGKRESLAKFREMTRLDEMSGMLQLMAVPFSRDVTSIRSILEQLQFKLDRSQQRTADRYTSLGKRYCDLDL